jgi:hypothetical protein
MTFLREMRHALLQDRGDGVAAVVTSTSFGPVFVSRLPALEVWGVGRRRQ